MNDVFVSNQDEPLVTAQPIPDPTANSVTAGDDSADDSDTPTGNDPRHQRRVALMQALFAYSFSDSLEGVDPELATDIQAIVAAIPEIDPLLQTHALERPLAEINKVDLAVLRLIVFESKHKKTPPKVLLDEAVELAKEFGTESSPAFVNGVLGTVLIKGPYGEAANS